MNVDLIILSLWILFGGSHLFFSYSPVRNALTTTLGEEKFILFFTAISSISFALLVAYYASNRMDSNAITPFVSGPASTLIAIVFITFGMILMSYCIVEYTKSPMAAFSKTVPVPTGMARITRHPFLMGNVFLFGTHLLLAQSTADLLFFGGFVILAIAGMVHQDKKLLKKKGDDYKEFVYKTSSIPFFAIFLGRQKIVLSELNWLPIGLGLAVTFCLRYLHDSILADSGLWFILGMVGVGTVETFLAWKANKAK